MITPRKPEIDDREYLWFKLRNEIDVLVISDPATDKAAAAMDVGVGHLKDPEDVPGLAHFCEHMLFLGTTKYPDENSYSSYLSKHGGRSNAYTSTENTNYYFDVMPEFLSGALDRFAQFFISPLFTESSTEREMLAVNNENAKNLQSDIHRQYQLLKFAANSAHPFHKFGTGNLFTLRDLPQQKGTNVREELLRFHQTYYQPNAMKLVILGKEPVDILRSWAETLFDPVISKNQKAPDSFNQQQAFTEKEVMNWYNVVPVKDLRSLQLFFPLPPQRQHFREKPTSYVSHLIGHEAGGSLLSLLKKRGWGNNVSAGVNRTLQDFEIFKISIDLTEEGFRRREDVVCMVFQYIRMVIQAGPQDWIYDEIRRVHLMNFQFSEKSEPMDYVSALAFSMQNYPPEYIIAGPSLLEKFSEDLIVKVLNKLTPSNVIIFLSSKDFQGKTDQIERWYQTQYSVSKIDDHLVEQWNKHDIQPELHLPAPNDFIPSDCSLRLLPSQSSNFPQLIHDTAEAKIWHKQDDTFHRPKANVYIQFVTPAAYESPRASTYSHLFIELCEDALNEVSYNAEIAGLNFHLSNDPVGIRLIVAGYNEKLPTLTLKIVEKMRTLEIKEERFLAIKEKLSRQYKNFKINNPWELARHYAWLFLINNRWDIDEKEHVLQEATKSNVEQFYPRVLSSVLIESLFHGNVSKDEVNHLQTSIQKTLAASSLFPSEYPQSRVVQLSQGHRYLYQRQVFDSGNKNSAIYYYSQVGVEDMNEIVKLELLCQTLREPAFSQLRTKEQLGYLLWTGVCTLHGIQGLRVIIQSSDYDPVHLHNRTTSFLTSFMQVLQEMTEEEYGKHVAALIAKKLEKDRTLTMQSNRYWHEISHHQFEFERANKEVVLLKELKKEDLIRFFGTLIDPVSEKTLCVHVFGCNHPVRQPEPIEHYTIVNDWNEFHRKMPLYRVNC